MTVYSQFPFLKGKGKVFLVALNMCRRHGSLFSYIPISSSDGGEWLDPQSEHLYSWEKSYSRRLVGLHIVVKMKVLLDLQELDPDHSLHSQSVTTDSVILLYKIFCKVIKCKYKTIMLIQVWYI